MNRTGKSEAMKLHGDSRTAQGCVAVVGMFDGVHVGHQYLLEHLRKRARELGLLPLAVTFSNHPLEIVAPERAPRLLSTPEEKLLLLAREGVEVAMIPFDEALRHTSTRDFMRMLRQKWNVRRLIMGFNNRLGHDAPESDEAYAELGRSEGIEVERYTEFGGAATVSSSAIRRLIEAGEIGKANRLLGRAYCVEGIVGHGKAVGRTIGFPTANVVPDYSRKLIPAQGVYAAIALTASAERYPAMVNIGLRPTINHTNAGSTIEAHMIGFSGDLYGVRLTLEFKEYVRPEERFGSLNELQRRIAADREHILALLGKMCGK